jgi:hypothetical protein
VACAVAVIVLALVRGGDVTVAVGLRIAIASLACLVGALALGLPRLLPVPFLLLGGAYAVYLAVDDVPLDPSAPVLAAGLLLSAELGYWSLEEREKIPGEPGETLRRIAMLLGLGAAALLVSGALLALADVTRARGLAMDLVGATAAGAVLALIVLFSRRPS